MVSREKLLSRLLHGASDASIPFAPLCSLLRDLGFEERVKSIPEILNLQPKKSKAKVYQVRQVRNLLLKYQLTGDGDDE